MKRLTNTLLLALAILFSVGIAAAQQNKAEKLYQEGLYQMEGMGDYTKAIEIFDRLVKEFPRERAVAARAQLHIGLCYEKLGLKEAQKAFQSVVDKYPEQTQEVALAKERLAKLAKALTEETHKPSFRKIRIPANPGNGVLSPDGKLLAFTSQGSVWVVPISGKVQPDLAGEPVRLTEPMGAWNMGNIMAWSGDGQWIAFNARDDKEVLIYVVSASGGKTKKIPVNFYRGNHVYNYRLSLSADGKTVAFCSRDITTSKIDAEKDEPLLLYTIPVDGGEAKCLTDAEAREPAFSPDGKRIVFTRPYFLENGKVQKDLWIINSDGTKPTKVTEFPGRARGPVWSPDGKMIAFHYEPGGSNFSDEIWIVPAPVDQKPAGAQTKIKLSSESLSMIAGWTTDNKIGVLLTNPEHQAVYTVPASGGKATQVSPEAATRFTGSEDFEGYPCHPRWSPDGKTIYFRWGKGHIVAVPSQGGMLSYIHSSKDTKLIEVLPGGGNDVSPDGKKVVFAAGKEGVRPLEVNVWTIPAEGGKPKQITKGLAQDRYPCWSPDGKRIAFIRTTEKSKDEYIMNIYIVPAEGGDVRQLTTEADRVNYSTIKWAPDGNQIAYFSLDKTIKVKPLQGGEPRVVVNVEDVHSHSELCWSPDGKELAYTSKGRIMVVSLEGGEPREIKTGILNEEVQNFHIDWSPDGKKFAFTAGFGGDEELWLMENFLPKEEKEVSFGTTLKQLNFKGLNTPFARLSPDGMKMAYVEYVQNYPKRIHVLDLSSESDKVLVDSGAGGQFSLVWSPHSDNIAYTFRSRELRVRDIDREDSRVLLKNSEYQIYPSDWSRDEKKILCFFEGDDWTTRIGTITTGGQVQFLVSGNSSEFRSEPKFSPDGKYIACSLERAGNTDIYVWAADGSREVRVTDHPGRDDNPVWSPDGKYLVFLSDRNRSVDLWAVQMRDGATVGGPFILRRDLGWRTRIYDFTASGKLSMLALGGAEPQNLFVVPVDQGQGNLRGAITPISLYPTDHFFPRYSPNGKMVAYLSRRGQIGWPRLFVLDENGSERELALQGHYAVNVAWHPENRSLFFAGWDKTGNAGIYERSLDKEEIRTVYSGDRVDMKTFGGALININLLPDAKKIMFFKYLGGGDVEVHTYELAGQNSAVVLPRVNMPIWGSPSPTGENICYRIGDSLMLVSVSKGTSKVIGSSTLDLEATWAPNGESFVFRERSALRIFSLKENTSRTLYQAPAGKTIGGMELYGVTWSPNGGYVIFTERDTSASSVLPQKLFLISPRDGSLKTLGEAPDGYRLSDLRWSPDGSKILATGKGTSSARAPLYEYWVMENFLPKEEKVQK